MRQPPVITILTSDLHIGNNISLVDVPCWIVLLCSVDIGCEEANYLPLKGSSLLNLPKIYTDSYGVCRRNVNHASERIPLARQIMPEGANTWIEKYIVVVVVVLTNPLLVTTKVMLHLK